MQRDRVVLVWPAEGPVYGVFWSDGRFFGHGDVCRDESYEAFDAGALSDVASDFLDAVCDAFDWGRDVSAPPPTGWRYAARDEPFYAFVNAAVFH